MEAIKGLRLQRGNSTLNSANLTDAQREEIYTYCKSHSGEKASAWVESTFGVKVSRTAMDRWFKRENTLRREDAAFERVLHTVRTNRELARSVGDDLGKASLIHVANMHMIHAEIFHELHKGEDKCDWDKIVKLLSPAIRDHAQTLKKETIELAAQKHKEALRTKIDAGLEALGLEIRNNPRALEIYQQLKEALNA